MLMPHLARSRIGLAPWDGRAPVTVRSIRPVRPALRYTHTHPYIHYPLENMGQHVLPPLHYAYNALEPAISAQIMELHHSKHHQAYVDGLNKAELELAKASDIKSQIALQTTIRFMGGGHTNHSLFWRNLKPTNDGGGQLRDGSLAKAITEQYGSLDALKAKVNAAGLGIYGSGWVWLGYSADHERFEITTTKDQDPLLDAAVLFGIDMWEHAFYLQYLNKKADYVKAIWDVIDWDEVQRRYDVAKGAGKAKA